MKPSASAPIGIFDSGIGGLTVVKAVQETLPHENIVYFGDTARVPYGIKSVETVQTYARQITRFLIEQEVKLILIACNTVAAAAEAELVSMCAEHGISVLGVIDAGSRAILSLPSKAQRVGVIGTLATIGSRSYEKKLTMLNPDIQVYSKACPLLVPLAEEGWADHPVSDQVLEIYLEDFKNKSLDALILGCTHYPLFKKGIQAILGNVLPNIVDSAHSIALQASSLLTGKNLLHPNSSQEGNLSCFVSDKPQRFQHLAELFLGKRINQVEIVTLPS